MATLNFTRLLSRVIISGGGNPQKESVATSATPKDEYWKRKERMNLDDLGIGFPQEGFARYCRPAQKRASLPKKPARGTIL
jgi:hypothetical protein